MNWQTLVVNLFGGPGTGKSTNAALLFGKLKAAGVSAELVTEFAKDLTWEGRHGALGFQPYVMGKQMWKLERVLGQVDVVVTDSPILLGCIYADGILGQATWVEFLLETHRAMNTMDIFLVRDPAKPYDTKGRNQSSEEAAGLDKKINEMLTYHNIPHDTTLAKHGSEETADLLTRRVLLRLQEDRYS